jgi:spoIIIJ-associated protein
VQVADSAEGSGRTVDAAVEAARRQLGVDRNRVDVEVLEEPIASSFGVIGRPARVRLTLRAEPRPDAGERGNGQADGDTRRPGERPLPAEEPRSGRPSAPRPRADVDPETAIQHAELGGDFVEELLELLDLEADITTWGDPVGGHVDVEGPDLDVLVGKDGEVLTALEELTRLAVVRQTGDRARVSLDIDGYKRRRREIVAAAAREAAARVQRQGIPEELTPMPPYERKIVHDVIAETPGLHTESVGEEPRRRVIITHD